MSERQAATAVQAATTSKCPHPEAVGKRWGDPIREERQAELQGYLDRWATEKDHGDCKGPFDRPARAGVFGGVLRVGVSLTGADTHWLAKQSGYGALGSVPNLHLEGANLSEGHLEDAALNDAHLEGASLLEAHLEGAYLMGAHLERHISAQCIWKGPLLTTRTWRGLPSQWHG